jgi:ubiquinone/menaquinone biosynthesis C-methylase UbiE
MRREAYDKLMTPSGEQLSLLTEGESLFLVSDKGLRFPVIDEIACFLHKKPLSGNNGIYQEMYDRIARFYDLAGKFYAFLKSGSEEKRVAEYLSLLTINDNDSVIEISVGTGRNIKYLNPNAHYFGVDISFRMLQRCRNKFSGSGRDLTLIQAEAESLPIRENSFDVVFSAGGFNFFNDPGKALLEMIRIARPGVRILITDETEAFRLKHTSNKFYNQVSIKDPRIYLPESCTDIEYREICNGDLWVLTFVSGV